MRADFSSLLGSGFVDITAPRTVEVLTDEKGARLWVNVEGVCVLRLCRIESLTINDERGQRS